MGQYDLIADKIEVVMRQMFADFNETNPIASEFSILFNPIKHNTWFISVFFKDKTELNAAIKNGTCYSINKYLLNKFDEEFIFANIHKLIVFEPGSRPSDTSEFDALFDRLTVKLQALQNAKGNVSETICSNCGHDFNNHELRCISIEENETPKEGWIMCPEENCTCFQTWSANYDSIPAQKS
jgi:hypothetical protein